MTTTREPGSSETRSVGELLRDADVLSRQLLFDVGADDGPAMLRTWGEVVEAAADLWRVLPSYPVTATREATAMTRMETLSREMHRILARDGLADGPAHDALSQIRDRYAAAEDLVNRFGTHIAHGRTRPEDVQAMHADVAAARARLIHGLYITAHAVGVAARAHLGATSAPSDVGGGSPGREALDRLASMEHLAGSYVARRTPAAYDGEHHQPRNVLDRLEHAIARWDIEAHRTLARSPTPANLTLVARVQADTAAMAARVMDAGQRVGSSESTTGYARSSPALEITHVGWHQSAARWSELSAPGCRADQDLVQAAGEIRAVYREMGHDRSGHASPLVMASRVSLSGAGRALQDGLSTGVDLAYASSAIAAVAPLEARAGSIVRRCAIDLAEPGDTSPGIGERLAFDLGVRPGDVHANRTLPLPEPLRDRLMAHMNGVVGTAINAVSATAWLDQPSTDTTRDPTALTRSRPRGIQERLPMDYSPGAPASPGHPGR